MIPPVEEARGALTRRARALAWGTIAWNVFEGVVAIGVGVRAGSLALVGFGLDSFVETFSGVVVLWQLRGIGEDRKERALRLIALSFFAVAAYVAAEAVRDLAVGREAGESSIGVALAAASLAVMPLLAWAKRRTGHALGNAVVLADATETALCSYLSAVLLVGLVVNATLSWWWADTVAALVIAVLAVREGREAWRGEPCTEGGT